MSKALIEKLRKARELTIEAGGHKFIARRPTDSDALELVGIKPIEFVQRFVVGWDLVELDVIAGGGPETVPFDPALWSDWVADHPELWQPISSAIMDAYTRHVQMREESAKN